MGDTYLLAAVWLGLALVAALISIWLGIATALSEILVGIIAQLIIGTAFGAEALGAHTPWVQFLAGTGAIVLTFLAGAELDPEVFRRKLSEATAVGVASFIAPFLGCTAVAYYLLHWGAASSWLAGVALSTTSVAVVYAVMLEFGLNKTDYGKTVLAACFVTDLGTVLALGLLFSPFGWKAGLFFLASIVALFAIRWITPRFFKRYGNRPSELEAKYLLLALFGLGGFAIWAGSEAVLPAYVLGMALAGTVGRDHVLVRRLRTVTFGLLTPFYFVRAGSFVQLPALWAAPAAFLLLLASKIGAKFVGVYPVTAWFKAPRGEAMYTTLLMSTGLTFGSISALFGLSHGIINQSQYSLLILTVIASAVVPTLIANAWYLPRHLLETATEGPSAVAAAAKSEGS
jgi:glutathione-regulated potassium-efflux system ancillary protein KefC